ncbi:receptor-type tyrosine-protein phosphatase beta-like isoform X2 [Vanacampus margaritifer]
MSARRRRRRPTWTRALLLLLLMAANETSSAADRSWTLGISSTTRESSEVTRSTLRSRQASARRHVTFGLSSPKSAVTSERSAATPAATPAPSNWPQTSTMIMLETPLPAASDWPQRSKVIRSETPPLAQSDWPQTSKAPSSEAPPLASSDWPQTSMAPASEAPPQASSDWPQTSMAPASEAPPLATSDWPQTSKTPTSEAPPLASSDWPQTSKTTSPETLPPAGSFWPQTSKTPTSEAPPLASSDWPQTSKAPSSEAPPLASSDWPQTSMAPASEAPPQASSDWPQTSMAPASEAPPLATSDWPQTSKTPTSEAPPLASSDWPQTSKTISPETLPPAGSFWPQTSKTPTSEAPPLASSDWPQTSKTISPETLPPAGSFWPQTSKTPTSETPPPATSDWPQTSKTPTSETPPLATSVLPQTSKTISPETLPPAGSFWPQTSKTPTSETPPPATSDWPQTSKTPTSETPPLATSVLPQTSKTISPETLPPAGSFWPQTSKTPTSETPPPATSDWPQTSKTPTSETPPLATSVLPQTSKTISPETLPSAGFFGPQTSKTPTSETSPPVATDWPQTSKTIISVTPPLSASYWPQTSKTPTSKNPRPPASDWPQNSKAITSETPPPAASDWQQTITWTTSQTSKTPPPFTFPGTLLVSGDHTSKMALSADTRLLSASATRTSWAPAASPPTALASSAADTPASNTTSTPATACANKNAATPATVPASASITPVTATNPASASATMWSTSRTSRTSSPVDTNAGTSGVKNVAAFASGPASASSAISAASFPAGSTPSTFAGSVPASTPAVADSSAPLSRPSTTSVAPPTNAAGHALAAVAITTSSPATSGPKVQSSKDHGCPVTFMQVKVGVSWALLTFSSQPSCSNFTATATRDGGRRDSVGHCRPVGSAAPNFTCAVTRLRAGSGYRVSITSAQHGLRGRVQVRTVPDGVSALSATSLPDGSALRLTWTPPSGDWDKYSVLLRNGRALLLNDSLGKLSRSHVFPAERLGLLPGRVYGAEVTVHSGKLANTTSCQAPLAPGPVQQLAVHRVDESSIHVQWRAPRGEWDGLTAVIQASRPDSAALRKLLPREATGCAFGELMPGRLYTVTVATTSGNLSTSASVKVWTTPSQVSGLQLADLGSTESLSAQWRPTSGDVDSYLVVLVHEGSVIKNQSVPADAVSLTFQDLRPGALYKVVVTTVRASRSSRQTVAEGRTVPAAVGQVTASNNGRMDFLSVSWRPASGWVDSYLVTLSHGDRTLHSQVLSKSSQQCVFSSLVSGRLYDISIDTCSGSLRNRTSVQERTQPSKVQNPTAVHGARDDFLKVYWRPASGDVDLYRVSIRHHNVELQNQTVSRLRNQCVFYSLVPGRLYTVVVSTCSGDYQASASTHGRTFPAPVRSLRVARRSSQDLWLAWTAAPGDVDHYQVQLLFNDIQVFPPLTLGGGAAECPVTSLTPGRLYKVMVSTFSGPNQRTSFIEGRTVPSQVKNLHVSNGGDSSSLTVSWTAGQGDVDRYVALLYRQNRQLDTRPVLRHNNRVVFGSLQPGQLYDVTVRALSGDLSSDQTASGRTVPSAVTALLVENPAGTSGLQASWQEAAGVSDGYFLQLLDERGAVLANATLIAVTRHTFDGLSPGRQYDVLVRTTSGGAQSAGVAAQARTRPAAATQLSVKSNTSTSLAVCWSRPAGDLDSYDILLYGTDEVLRERRQVGPSGLDCLFRGLVPGSAYKMVVITRSGHMSNRSSIWAATVPSAVTDLRAQGGDGCKRLQVLWRRGQGGVDGYRVSLSAPDGSLRAREQLGPEVTEFIFGGLTPGRLYRVDVLTLSNNLANGASVHGRTAPRAPSSFLLGGVTNTSVEVTWTAPLDSDYEDFDVRWTPPDRGAVVNPYEDRRSGSRIVRGMFPGRLYNFSLRAVSGGGGGVAPPSYSLPIQRSIRTRPSPVVGLHCRPHSSTSISCSWAPPEADFDSYTVECVHDDSHSLVYSRRSDRRSDQRPAVYVIDLLEPHKRYSVYVKVISDASASEAARDSVRTMIDRPPVPPASTRVDAASALATDAAILFRFNCSWFSDVNGAVKFFSVVVTESQGAEAALPERRHPLPSYADYMSNASIKCYQTALFASAAHVCSGGGYDITVGAGADALGGSCQRPRDHQHFCDGPLKAATAYRLSVRAFTQVSDGVSPPLFADTFLSLPVRTATDPAAAAAVVGGTAAAAAVVFLVVVMATLAAFIVYRRNVQAKSVQESVSVNMCVRRERALPRGHQGVKGKRRRFARV